MWPNMIRTIAIQICVLSANLAKVIVTFYSTQTGSNLSQGTWTKLWKKRHQILQNINSDRIWHSYMIYDKSIFYHKGNILLGLVRSEKVWKLFLIIWKGVSSVSCPIIISEIIIIISENIWKEKHLKRCLKRLLPKADGGRSGLCRL